MKTLSLEKMEVINGGYTVVSAPVNGTSTEALTKAEWECLAAIGTAVVFGTGGVIATAGSGGLAIGFAMLSNYAAWGNAAYTCSKVK
jgi:Amino acid transporters